MHEKQCINLLEINTNEAHSILTHKLLTQHAPETLNGLTGYFTQRVYTIDDQNYCLSHPIAIVIKFNSTTYQVITDSYTPVGNITRLAVGLCYFEEIQLSNRANKCPLGSPSERIREIQKKLDELNPLKHLSEQQQNQVGHFPLPHTREYKQLKSDFNFQQYERHTAELASKWENRINHYADAMNFAHAWPVQRLDPTTLTIHDEAGRLLSELMDYVSQLKLLECIYADVNIPFRGVQFNLTHLLIPRMKSKGHPCLDLVENKSKIGGHFGSIKHIDAVLQFNEQHQLIRNTPPKHNRAYKLSSTEHTLYQEFLRAQCLDYLHVKNNKSCLFSMREIPGINLHHYMKQLRKMKRHQRFQAWLMLTWKCYESLHRFIATNDGLNNRHGDLNPGNIMVEIHPKEISIKFVDLDPSPFTRLYSPHEKLHRDLLRTPKHDIYTIGRVLALALGDTHPIWVSPNMSVFHYFVNKPANHLLSHLFKYFDEAKENDFASITIVETLKQTFIRIHELWADNYPSAKELKDIFHGLYSAYQAHQNTKTSEQPAATPSSRL